MQIVQIHAIYINLYADHWSALQNIADLWRIVLIILEYFR